MMPDRGTTTRSARTVLELRIRERRQTFEEFVEYAETFARQHGERGTLSVRHLQRLAAGRRTGGHPPGQLRPATARLLEHIFDTNIDQLLATPANDIDVVSGNASTHLTTQSPVQALRVAVAIVLKKSEVLIVCRRSHDRGEINWQFPAGIVKPQVPIETAAIHETFAETDVHCSVVREIGSRVHPITNVICHYLLCTYLTGEAKNVDIVENSGVAWTNKKELTQFIPAKQIFPPIIETLAIPQHH